MLSLAAILPSALGLRWGLSMEPCLTALQVAPDDAEPRTCRVRYRLDDEDYALDLSFAVTAHGLGLVRLDVVVQQERPNQFLADWEPQWIQGTWRWTDPALDALGQACMREYQRLVAAGKKVFGRPFRTHNGPHGTPVTAWHHRDGNVQVALDFGDEDGPDFRVFASCYQP